MTIRRSRRPASQARHLRKKARLRRPDLELRKLALEPLEQRQLLAVGPRLAGIQPTDGTLLSTDRIDVRSIAPRDLKINFDENQTIDPTSLSGIRVMRAGGDGNFDDGDEVFVQPGFIGVSKSPQSNEVIVRFAESLPDDLYRVEVFGADNPGQGIQAVRNTSGDRFVPSIAGTDRDTVYFELDLAPQVLGVVPQPVRRNDSGALVQARNTIEVYFNSDALLVRNDDVGNPAPESVENPDFYQLIFTSDTVRNTDDIRIKPARVVYDRLAAKVTLTFAQNLDQLVDPDTGAVVGPGTFRLRVGTNESAPLPPMSLAPVLQVSSDFNTNDRVVLQFTAVRPGENGLAILVNKRDQGQSGPPLVHVVGNTLLFDLNTHPGSETRAIDLVNAVNSDPAARMLVVASINQGDSQANIAAPVINYSPLSFVGLGSSFDTAANLSDDTDLGPVLVINGAGSVFRDGDFFQITDASNVVRTFEFDSNVPAVLNDRSAVGITFSESATQDAMARAILQAINGATFGVRAELAGNWVRLSGDKMVDLGSGVSGLAKFFQSSFDNGPQLVAVAGGADLADGQTFEIEDSSGVRRTFEFDAGLMMSVPAPGGAAIADGQTFVVSDGVRTVTFEFENIASAPGVAGTNVPVLFASTDSQANLSLSIRQAILGQVMLGNLVGFAPFDLGSGQIHLGGNAGSLVDPAGTPALSVSGQPGAQQAGAVAVPFVPHASFTTNDVSQSVARAINAAGFAVQGSSAGSRVRLAGDRAVRMGTGLTALTASMEGRFDSGPVLEVTSNGSTVQDGQSITIRDDEGVARRFEFDSNGTLRDPTAIAVSFTGAESSVRLAELLANAINATDFRVEATTLDGRIYLTNDRDVGLDPGLTAISATSQGLVISSSIDPLSFLLDYAGGVDEPGHRDIPEEVGDRGEQHINSDFANGGRDAVPGVTTIFYNFRSDYGTDPQGTTLLNAITPEQRQRTREVFQLWAKYLGVQFLESDREGLTIATGDLRALNTNLPEVLDYPSFDFRVRIDPEFSDGLLVMDSSVAWNDEFAGSWFRNAMVGIGSMLGLERANDLPRSTMMAFTSNFSFPNSPTPEPIFPGNADIVHGQHMYRPDGTDIDMYRFTIELEPGKTGLFTAETFAERQPNSSLLNTVVSLYRENPDGTRELVARNDDYYSKDSYLELALGAGTYYIGVSASGNTSFDPTIDDTGIGGRSQGAYDLRLNFRSQVAEQNTIRDADLTPTPLDGDADGEPGGVHNFWFQTRPLNRILEVVGNGTTFRDGQVLTLVNSQGVVRQFEFDSNNSIASGNIRVAFTSATTSTQLAQTLSNAIFAAGIGINATVTGNQLTLEGERSVTLGTAFSGVEIHGKTIFVDKTAGPNADGSLARPFNNVARTGITNAFAATHPDDIVRIVGNGGTDGNSATLADNFAYEFGFGTLPNQILSDGTEMAVPQGVTVMVEPGTVFKMRRSWLGVGSSSLLVDRSGGALQILGTPSQNVYFTSWLDETIGRDTHPPVTRPARGDWGGIIFRNDVDSEEARPTLEDEGIFLNYVNQAQVLYGGGGNVVIDSNQQIVNPIQIAQTRPTVSFNTIRESADSAMSATPDSFDETNFHAPRYQSAGVFTSDYDRVGPDIHGNRLLNNSTNGLFIRIQTPAGNELQPLTVPGRFDDTDVVHVIAENLVIQGGESEPYLDLARPAVDLVTYSPRIGGTLPAGTYNYKLTFVDRNGFEGRPSKATADITIGGAVGSVQLNQLPPTTGDFVTRRIYRSEAGDNGVYTLVAEINASDTVYVDTGISQNATLQRDPPDIEGVTLAPQTRGSLAKGTYNYRIVFVDAEGREGASSDATASLSIAGATQEGGIVLSNLPSATGSFVGRRIYRSTLGGISPYTLVAELDASTTTYVDDGYTEGGTLDASSFGVVRARPSARLRVDPGTVVKLEGARIESAFGAQFIAEGRDGQEVIFTSRLDDQYGAGGTFDTNNDDNQASGENAPSPGDWGGLFFGQLSTANLDHAVVSYGGGINRIEGTFIAFNAIEIHQADVRIANSVIENNALGIGGQGPLHRFGRGYNLPAVIFVRGAQPVIVDNIIRDNYDPANTAAANTIAAITINANSLTSELLTDPGRETGTIDLVERYPDNRGPLVRGNRLDNNGLNGMVVRGEELTTQSVWDDTDIVHIVTNRYDRTNVAIQNRFENWTFDEILIPELHIYGGLRLQSSPVESLVVKLEGAGNVGNLYNLNPTNGAGFTATGRRLGQTDRVGGTIEIVGQPGFPVVLTSIHDDTVGAGTRPDDKPQTDSNNNGIASIPRPNDWRSVRLDQFSNDRNVEILNEKEDPQATAPGVNGTAAAAEVLGVLAANEMSADDNLRLGFEIHGLLNEPSDIDVYSFTGVAGTEVWVDIDRTTQALDTVIELLDSNGKVLARSNNTITETDEVEFVSPDLADNLVNPLQKSPVPFYPTHASGLPKDYYSTNVRDAGMRISLPGVSGAQNTYHLRVRSDRGLTSGVYQLQVRLKETDEFPGSTVRYADIRYANNGVELIGLPKHSPLLGESQEDEETGSSASNNSFTQDPVTPGNRPQNLGNLLTSDRGALSVAGSVGSSADVDFYQFDVTYTAVTSTTTHHSSTVFDVDYADSLLRPNTILSVFDSNGRLVLIGRDSNIAEDRPGPLAGADLSDLTRGSVGPGDPFIGPVELPQGTYYTVVSSNARIPTELINNPLVRLEPVNSTVRIAEDHIGISGGSTAAAPIVPQLFDPTFVGTGSNQWRVTNRRSSDLGHGVNSSFDGSRGTVSVGSIGDFEPNSSIATAQNIDGGPWNLGFDPNVGDFFMNTSTQIPHITINGSGDGTFDYFEFTVSQAGETGIFDIDFGDTGSTGSFDTEIFLYDTAGNLLAANDDSSTTWGDGGSTSFFDSYLQYTFAAPGRYILGIGEFSSFGDPGGITGNPPDPGDLYTLQISLANHSVGGIGGNADGGDSFYFGNPSTGTVPAGSTGSLVSSEFSLAGYSAEDLPTMYFNYYLDAAAADRFRVYVVDPSGGGARLLASSNQADLADPSVVSIPGTSNSVWRQLRLSLGQFAGKSDLRLRFDFDRLGTGLAEGVYVDDVIIGFAERGEMVTGANANSTSFVNNPAAPAAGSEILTGDYQLEIRRASEFGRSSNFGSVSLILEKSIDTNDRLVEQTTLIAPDGGSVVEGQTFVVSDGVNSVTFEYEDPAIGNGVSAGRVEIRFKSFNASTGTYALDPSYVIARRIRDAINSPQVQTRLKLRAALSDGAITGTTSRDDRINLFGTASVAIPDPFQVTQTTTDPNALRDAILGTGINPVQNASFVGSDLSAAFFTGGRELLGMESGILLTTGAAAFANKPNSEDNSTGRASSDGDADLDAEFGVTTQDSTSLEFQFQFGDGLVGGDLFLNFLFASEEYNESVGQPFADVVAIFVDGVNIALVPGTTPSQAVGINTVNGGNPFNPNGGANATFFRNNDPNEGGSYLEEFGYDGFTTTMTAQALGLTPGAHTIKLVVSDVGDMGSDSALFVEAGSMGTLPFVRPPEGIESIRHEGFGDQNHFRDQGQVLVHSNSISNALTFGVASLAGRRDSDETPFASFSQDIRLLEPSPGPVRNLSTLDGTPAVGGFATGVVIANNTISEAGVGGIHFAGSSRPWELTARRGASYPDEVTDGQTAGDAVCDGARFTVTAYGTSVTFEFDDISGSAGPCGSAQSGGNGWTDGNVPIFYRRTTGPYTALHPTIPNINRSLGYNQFEMAEAINDAIEGSILITNLTTLVIESNVGESRSRGIDTLTASGADDAVFLEHVSSVTGVPGFDTGLGNFRQVSVSYGPQPFGRIINNTIYGNDGSAGFFPEAAVEPNDTIENAIDTRQGRAHNTDVYSVNARIGDTVNFREDLSMDVDYYQFQLDVGDRVQIDVDAASLGSSLNSSLRLFNSVGEQMAFSDNNPAPGEAASNDSYIDFTATRGGTYYVAVSNSANVAYSPTSLADRVGGGSAGTYTLNVNVFAPRQAVLTVQDPSTYADGETFRITQIPNLPNANTNVLTFEFDTGGGVTPGNFPINVPATGPGNRSPEMAVIIANAINAAATQLTAGNNPPLLGNVQSLANSPFPNASPLQRVIAFAVGGNGFDARINEGIIGLDHIESGLEVGNERFVVIRNLARFEDGNSGIQFTPTASNNNDNLVSVRERGILISEQSTPTLLNNIIANARFGVEQVAFQPGSPGPADTPNPGINGVLVEGGSLYQFNQFGNSNIPRSSSDFQFALGPNDPLFVNAADGNFYPAPFAMSIDSAINSLEEREVFKSIKLSNGLSLSPILVPDRDATGQLRVDDPSVSTPTGLGSNVFKDRGSLDRADFVGPAATLINPQDNDAGGNDVDSAVSIIQLQSGVFSDFSIQLVDGFESADPFPGVGIMDTSVEGRVVTVEEDGIQLQIRGPAITIFRDGKFLREGQDYTFRYDSTSNTIRLSPLAGIWPDDKVYVIRLNNRDRFVIDAPVGSTPTDGNSFNVSNAQGDTATYEYDSRYLVKVAPTLSLLIPAAGTGTGGIADGDRFSIDDGTRVVVFEFDRNGNVLPGSRPISFTLSDSVDQLAESLAAAMRQAVLDGELSDLAPRNVGGGRVHVGATEAHYVNVTNSQLTTSVAQYPLALVVPSNGALGLVENESFLIRNGLFTVRFEFDMDGSGPSALGNQVINISPTASSDQVADALATALAQQPLLGLQPVNAGGGVVTLGASASNTIDVTTSSLVRTVFVGGVADGETFAITSGGGPAIVFEYDNDGVVTDLDGNQVPDNRVIPFSNVDTHEDIATRTAAAIGNAGLGLSPYHYGDGRMYVGGTTSYVVDINNSPNLSILGRPGVQPSTTLQLPSSLAVQVPAGGGAFIPDGSTFVVANATTSVTFEFDSDGTITAGNTRVSYTAGSTVNQIAFQLVNVLNSSGLGLSTFHRGNGLVDFRNGPGYVLDVQNSNLIPENLIAPSVVDGQTFTIDAGGGVVATFEFENAIINNGVATGNVGILFRDGDRLATVANTMAAAIRSGGVGLTTATSIGNGAVRLNDLPNHLTNVTLSALTKSGVPGGAIPIDYRPDFTDDQMAKAIVDAINTGRLRNTTAEIRGGSTLFVNMSDGQGGVADFDNGMAAIRGINNFFLSAIQDSPGNSLKPNQVTNDTQFVILLPGVQLDFGDAPDPFSGTGRYPTLFENNGARHVVTDNPLTLGTRIDAETGASTSLVGDGDDADHVVDLGTSSLRQSMLAPYTVQVPVTGGAALVEGRTFTLGRRGETALVFEWDTDGVVLGTNVPVAFTPTDTADVVANNVVAAIQGTNLALSPANLGNGLVFVGGRALHSVDASQSSIISEGNPPNLLRIPADPATVVRDGEIVRFSDGINVLVLELDTDASGPTGTGRVAVAVTAGMSSTQLADAIRQAIVGSSIAIQAASTGTDASGRALLHLDGASSHILDVGTSGLLPTGRTPSQLTASPAGLAVQVPAVVELRLPAAGGSALGDGSTFTIFDGLNPEVTFEFDSGGGVSAGHRRVIFAPSHTATTIGNAAVAAIQQAVTEGLLTNTNPRHVGNGIIDIGGGIFHQLSVSAGALSQRGPVADGQVFTVSDGASAVAFEFDNNGSVAGGRFAVPFEAVNSADDLTSAIVTEIKNRVAANSLRNLNPVNVGGGVVDLGAGAGVVINLSGTPLLTSSGVAGGVADGQVFTIRKGNATYTFEFDRNGKITDGNFIVPFTGSHTADHVASAIATAISQSGVSLTASSLGGGVVHLEGADEDGVVVNGVFIPGRSTPITVTASGEGFLQAWFDWNQDGDWEDPGETVFDNVAVHAGANSLTVPVPDLAPLPSTLPLGLTFARFRLSTAGNLLPTGLAVDGEVEDYRVRVITNEAPNIIVPELQDQVVNEDAADTLIDLSLHFDDIDIHNGNGDFLTYSVVSNDNSTLVAAKISTDGKTLALDYQANQNGIANLQIRATDQGGLFTEQPLLVRVNPINDPPVATSATIAIGEDVNVTIQLQADDGDPERTQVLSYAIDIGPSHGVILGFNAATGRIQYRPNANFVGQDTIVFSVTDDNTAGGGALASPRATVTIQVNPVNDPPVAISATTTAVEDGQVAITLTGSGGDPGIVQVLTYAIAQQPVNGVLLGFDPVTGTVNYRPNANFVGTDTFLFTVTDDQAAGDPAGLTSVPATVTIQVTPVNDAPVASDAQVTGIEDVPLAITFTANDGDPEVNQAMTFALVTPPTRGTLSGFNPATGAVTYTPNPGYNGIDTFTFQVLADDDTAGAPANLSSNTATITITIQPVNDAPVANDQLAVVNEDSAVGITMRGDDGDPELNQVLTFAIASQPANGVLLNFNAATGQVTYRPNANYNGTDTFTFTVRDNGLPNLTSAPATVTVNVAPVNDPPSADSQSFNLSEDQSTAVTLTGTDGDAERVQALTYAIVVQPAHGTISGFNAATGQLTYTPSPDYNGTDSFSFTVTDDGTAGGAGLTSAPALVNFSMSGVNDAPQFTKGPDPALNEDAGPQAVVGWATGIRPGPLSAVDETGQTVTFLVANDNNALFAVQPSVNSSGTLTFTTAPNKNGVAVVTVQAIDNGSNVAPNVNLSAVQTFTITVNAVNDPPSFNKGGNRTVAEDSGAQSVLNWASGISPGPASATDESGQSVSFLVSNNNNGLFLVQPAVAPNGTLTFTPAPDANGVAVVTVRAQDNGPSAAPHSNLSAAQSFTISVTAVNDAPEFTPGVAPVSNEDAGLVSVNGWAADLRPGPDSAADEANQTLTFVTGVQSTTGTLAFVTSPSISPQTGTLSFQTAADTFGTAVVTVFLRDNGSAVSPNVNVSPTHTFTLTVNAVNDAPQFSKGADQLLAEDAGPQTVIGWATNIRPGPPTATDESSQTVSFNATSNNSALFSVQPAVSPNGTLTFTPAPDANGVAIVEVEAVDSGSGTAPNINRSVQTLTISVSAVNDAPQFSRGTNVVVAEDSGFYSNPWATNIRPGTATAIDEAGQQLTFNVTVTSTTGPMSFINPPSIDPSTGRLSFQTAQHANGTAVVRVALSDNGNGTLPNMNTSAPQTFTISVTAVNDAPFVANPVADLTVDEDSPDTVLELFPDVFNDPDIATNSDALTFQIVSNSNSSLVATSLNGTKLTLDYQANQAGLATVVVQARDRNNLTANDTFTVTVTAVNDAPVVADDMVVTGKNTPVTINVLGNDTDLDGTINVASVVIVSSPGRGTALVNANGTILYTPPTNYVGETTFRYTVQDDTGAVSSEANVTVKVNEIPQARNDTASTNQGTAVQVNVASNDLDIDGTIDATTVVVTSAPANGTASVNAQTGIVTYTPNSTFVGTDVFRYRVRDNNGSLSNEATVSVTVNAVLHWQNKPNALDVNDDGFVTAIDALQIINDLNRSGARLLPVPNATFAPPPYLDVTGDGFCSPADALAVVDHLNNASGEGEGPVAEGSAVGGTFEALVMANYSLVQGARQSVELPQLIREETPAVQAATGLDSTDGQLPTMVAEGYRNDLRNRLLASHQVLLASSADAPLLDEILAEITAESDDDQITAADKALDELFG